MAMGQLSERLDVMTGVLMSSFHSRTCSRRFVWSTAHGWLRLIRSARGAVQSPTVIKYLGKKGLRACS